MVYYNITQSPSISFLRNQLNYFEELYPDSHLIHDNFGELKYFPYKDYGIKGVATTLYSPKAGRKQAFCHPLRPPSSLL